MTIPASPLSVERLAELREQAEQSIASQGEYPDSCHLIAHSFIGEEMLALWNHAAVQAEQLAQMREALEELAELEGDELDIDPYVIRSMARRALSAVPNEPEPKPSSFADGIRWAREQDRKPHG